MARYYNKGRDKKVHKMTRNGIVEKNAVTGEIENISKREQELNLRMEQPGEQPIPIGRNHDIKTNSRQQQPEQSRKEQQKRYNQRTPERIAEATTGTTGNKINDAPESAEVILPSDGSIIDTDNTTAIPETPTGENRQLAENTTDEPKPEMRIHDKPILPLKKDDYTETEKEDYISSFDVAESDDNLLQGKPTDTNKPPEITEAPEAKGRLRFSKTETKKKAPDGVTAADDTDKSKLISEPEKVLNFEPDKSGKLQFDKTARADTSGKKRKPKNKRRYGDKIRDKSLPEAAAHETQSKTALIFKPSEQDSYRDEPGKAEQAGSKDAKPNQPHDIPVSADNPLPINTQGTPITHTKPDIPVMPRTQYRPQTGRPSKLLFTKDILTNKKGDKGKQKGNQYHQRFMTDDIKPTSQAEPLTQAELRRTSSDSKLGHETKQKPVILNNDTPLAADEIKPGTNKTETPITQATTDTGKLQFVKESKLSDKPAMAKPRKMSRKKKKRMKAEAARTENRVAQSNPEIAAVPVVPVNEAVKTQPDKPPVSTDTPPLKPHARLEEKPTRLQERPGKLKFDDTGQGKSTRTPPRQNNNRRIKETPSKVELVAVAADVKADTPLRQDKPDTVKPDTAKTLLGDEKETVKKPEKSSRLQFSADETKPKTDTKLTQLQKKAETYSTKLEKAKNKLPSEKKVTTVRVFDEAKGKAKTKLSFEKEILPPGVNKPSAAPLDLTKRSAGEISRLGTGKLHQKIYEVEHENVGIEAGHYAERAAETAFRGGKRVTRSTFQYIRNKPYRTVEKLEKKAVQANIKYSYRKALAENPKLKSNILSRYMQKRKIKKQYAQAAKNAKRTGNAVKKTGDITAKITKALAGVIKKHPVAAVVILLILLLVFFISTLFSSMAGLGGTGMSAILASSYLAEDAEIDAAELNYTEWETDLLMKVNRTETDYPGYDEYRYQADNIGHNPYELMAFLTAKFQFYEYADVEAVLQSIFNQQYTLTTTPSVETRYYEDADGELVPYDWHVLTVKLTSRSFTEIIMPHLDAEQTAIYALLMQTKGNRQYVDSPFDFNWLPNVSSNYGYRIHPITGAKDYHLGVDIAVPVGTDIKAGFDGKVTFAGYSGGYGYVVIIENDKGVEAKYAHCDSLLVSVGQEIKRGDVIAKSGNSGASTGPHLHMEVLKDGQYLNPLYFSVTNDTGFASPIFGSPGLPMGDGSYEALIAEAESHLGKRYVFGANGPNNFDCSSFVCWTLTNSGVRNTPRTTAQGLYNMSTPVSPADARPGDLVFFHSTYSTTNTVTHVGIYVGSGYMIHAGDPIQYTSINTSYWQKHFYAFGRLN